MAGREGVGRGDLEKQGEVGEHTHTHTHPQTSAEHCNGNNR